MPTNLNKFQKDCIFSRCKCSSVGEILWLRIYQIHFIIKIVVVEKYFPCKEMPLSSTGTWDLEAAVLQCIAISSAVMQKTTHKLI